MQCFSNAWPLRQSRCHFSLVLKISSTEFRHGDETDARMKIVPKSNRAISIAVRPIFLLTLFSNKAKENWTPPARKIMMEIPNESRIIESRLIENLPYMNFNLQQSVQSFLATLIILPTTKFANQRDVCVIPWRTQREVRGSRDQHASETRIETERVGEGGEKNRNR